MRIYQTHLEALVCGMVIGLMGLLYGTSAIVQSVNYADANDLVLAAKHFGLAHPPGYPLFVIMYGSLFRLFPNVSSSLVAGWTTAMIMALAAGLVCRLLINLSKDETEKSVLVLLAAPALSVLWGIQFQNWILGTVPEIMPIGLVLTLIFLLTSYQLYLKSKQDNKNWFIAGLVGIISGLYHPLLLGLVGWTYLGLGWINRHQWKRWIGYAVVGMLGGFLITVMLYGLISRQSGNYSWQIPETLGQWWQFWSRQVYADSGSAIETFSRDTSISKIIGSIGLWTRWWVFEQHGGWWLAAASVSLWLLLKRARNLGIWLIGLLTIYGPLLAAYLKHPEQYAVSEVAMWGGIALRERMFYIWPLLLVITVGLGFWRMANLAFGYKKTVLVIMAVILLVFTSRQAFVQHRRYGNETVNASSVFNDQLLTSLPMDSVLIVDDDEIFGLMASQLNRGTRRDVLIVPTGMILQPGVWKTKQLEFNRFGFTSLKNLYVADIIETSLDHNKNVFLYAVDAKILSFLGVEGDPWYVIPYGYLLKIASKPESVEAYNYGFTVQMTAYTAKDSPANFKWFRANLGLLHTQQTYYLSRLGYIDEAKWHADQADSLFYLETTKEVVKQTLKSGSERFLTQGSYFNYSQRDANSWINQGAQFIASQDFEKALYCYTRAEMLEPTNELIRKQVHGLYERTGRTNEADYQAGVIESLRNRL